MRLTFVLFLLSFSALQAQDRIAYLSNQSGNFDIFICDEDGNNTVQLTTNKGWDWSPKWNKYLNGILYNSNDTLNNFSIKLMDQSGMVKEFDAEGLEEYILSPDSKMVLYTLNDINNKYIGVFDTKTKSNKLLITYPAYNGRPEWAPNSKSFSFISNRDGNNELYVYHFSAGKSIRLTNSDKSEKYTSWMPDSKKLVYTYHYSDERDNERNDIFLIDIDTQKMKQITSDNKFYQEIDVSPDGKTIVFHGKRDGQDHLYTIDISGANEKQITQSEAYFGEPEWIPALSVKN